MAICCVSSRTRGCRCLSPARISSVVNASVWAVPDKFAMRARMYWTVARVEPPRHSRARILSSYHNVARPRLPLAFPAFVELHQDAIWIAEKDRAQVSLGVAKGVGWSTGLNPLGEQALRDCFNVGDGKRDVANADLIQHDRRATHRISWVLSQHQEGYRLRIAVAQVHHASLRVAIVIQVGQTAPTGVLHFVL